METDQNFDEELLKLREFLNSLKSANNEPTTSEFKERLAFVEELLNNEIAYNDTLSNSDIANIYQGILEYQKHLEKLELLKSNRLEDLGADST